MYLLYGLLLWIAAPLVAIYLAIRSLRSPGYYRTLPERFGWLGAAPRGGMWLHAISVGEVISAVGLIRRWKADYPNMPVCVSVGTLAGRKLADERLKGIADAVFYAPLDFGWIVRRFVRALRPRLVVVMETEIWPNLWRESKRAGAGLVVVNGRISDKAFPKYRRLRPFFRAVLRRPDRLLVQTDLYRDRYLALGAPADRIEVAGNLKYDFRPGSPSAAVEQFVDRTGAAEIWIAASTMPPAAADDPDEDVVVADVFESLAAEHPRLLLLLAPRRPERFETAASLFAERGIRTVRRSQLTATAKLELPGCLLLDSIGELSGLFALADVVFMGGTLVDRGGHNLLEPAYFGKPVISGPNLQNFPEIAADFRQAGALKEVRSTNELAEAVDKLLVDASLRAAFGERSRKLAGKRTGATERVVAALGQVHETVWPRAVHGPLATVALTPLSWLWRAGTAIDRRLHKPKRLPRPVIAIGGVAMGGVGKTPFAVEVARMLREMGRKPAFLTRGYGRDNPSVILTVPPGANVSATQTGDEALILLRSGLGPVGIGSDRHGAGERLLAEYDCDALVLDDAFQHWALARDVNIVLLDTLDPFGGGGVFPKGRLREPLSALGRADAIVLARAEPGGTYAGAIAQIRRWNNDAPIFRAQLVETEWVDGSTGLTGQPAGEVVAFCGLGNPESFWRSLRRLGVKTVVQHTFPDHHRYTVEELDEMGQISPHLVTTEKDWLNLPPEAAGRHRIWWLRIQLKIDGDPPFSPWLGKRLRLL
ncbi:MAG: tetraacyldisaccharide 4'-kinase [Bryobacterales bacterium]|nr:tetraacyldisaccharide 4'-kinase [Bryobacterales bacterium]